MGYPKSFSNNATIREVYGPAMGITTQEDADAYFQIIVEHGMKLDPELSREKVESNLRSNLGYFAGYYTPETRERVECLFKCKHPVFGSIKENGAPTPEEAFRLGVELGRQHSSEAE